MTQGESIRVSNMFLCSVHSKFREKKILSSLHLQTKGVICNKLCASGTKKESFVLLKYPHERK